MITLPINELEMKKTVLQGLQKLESTGVSFIAMPCNTVHAYYDFFQKLISVPLLNIVDETLHDIHSKRRITVLATSTTMNCGIYQKAIKKAGSTFVFKEKWQKDVDNLITGIKEGKTEGKHVITLWKKLCSDFTKERVQIVVLACTDLSVLPKSGFRFIDSSEELAKAVVKRYTHGL